MEMVFLKVAVLAVVAYLDPAEKELDGPSLEAFNSGKEVDMQN